MSLALREVADVDETLADGERATVSVGSLVIEFNELLLVEVS